MSNAEFNERMFAEELSVMRAHSAAMIDPRNQPAFPVTMLAPEGGTAHFPGMTLRDWFAGQAITMCLKDMSLPVSEWAREAYAVADAMLAERSK